MSANTPFVFDLSWQLRTGKNLSVFGCSSCLQKEIALVEFLRGWILYDLLSFPFLPASSGLITEAGKAKKAVKWLGRRSKRRFVVAADSFLLTVLEIDFVAAQNQNNRGDQGEAAAAQTIDFPLQ